MGLARGLTFGGAVALASASASPWFSYDPPECGWTCYTPTHIQPPEAFTRFGPATAWSGLGLWVALALGALLLVAVVALAVSWRRRRRVPVALAALAGACAATVVVRTATQPAILPGGRAGNEYVFVEAAAYVGVGAALVTAIGVALLTRLESPVA
jgi:hypothetical protein